MRGINITSYDLNNEELDLELNIKKRDKDYNSVIFNPSCVYVGVGDGQDTF